MNDDIGGYGSRSSSSVWFNYKAFRKDNGVNIPVGKFVTGKKGEQEEVSFVSGLMHSVSWRKQDGTDTSGPYNEILITLNATRNGEAVYYKIPLKASSTAAMSIARRFHDINKGELVEIGAFLSKDGPQIYIVKKDQNQSVKIPPEDPGVTFVDYGSATGPKLDMLKNQNAVLREEWVESRVKSLPYFDEGRPRDDIPLTDTDQDFDPFENE